MFTEFEKDVLSVLFFMGHSKSAQFQLLKFVQNIEYELWYNFFRKF